MVEHVQCCFTLFVVHLVLGYCNEVYYTKQKSTNLEQAIQFLREYDKEASDMCFRVRSAQWNYATNMTDHNKRRMIEEQMHKAKFDKVSWKEANNFDWNRMADPNVRRQLQFIITNGKASLPEDQYNEIYHLVAEMKDIYANVRICPYNSVDTMYCDLKLEPDIKRIMAHSRNDGELKHIWKEWHDKTGPQMRNRFTRYVNLANEAAELNGFKDAGEEMRAAFEDDDFENEVAESLQKVLPLYKELFTYVRRKLIDKYGTRIVRPEGPLPAHLLGNIWAQDWSNIADIILPYPEYGNFDITNNMLRRGITPLRIYQMAEEFYTSLGLEPMPPEFWRYSILDKPNDRKVQCTASAWDFCNDIDYRIKQCTEVTLDDLITAHHEMAHIQYYLYYAEQPYIYRDGANPGFHEAVSNSVILSVFNPIHLYKIGLLNNKTEIYESNINYLMIMALKKIVFAPFAYMVDVWRYTIFREGVQNMNSMWWDLRLRYQGIIPPVPRTEEHLDAAAKKHIGADMPYMPYYVALLLEFQIHSAMCWAAGHAGPLHNCDIYRSREAGRVLVDVLKVGRARHWKEVVKMLSRGKTDRLSSRALTDYFQPLLKWLRAQNKHENIVGWQTSTHDAALFQPLLYGSGSRCSINIRSVLFLSIMTIIGFRHLINLSIF